VCRRRHGQHPAVPEWGRRTIDSDQTNDDGIHREPIPDRTGRYRAVAVREELNAGADVCRRDRSPARRHRQLSEGRN
jgi:hypothetical protein